MMDGKGSRWIIGFQGLFGMDNNLSERRKHANGLKRPFAIYSSTAVHTVIGMG